MGVSRLWYVPEPEKKKGQSPIIDEIAIRIANAPLDIALSAKEFIDKPSIMSAAGILPFFPGSAKKIDDLLGGVKGTRLRSGIQYPKSGGIRKACEDWKKLTEGVQVTRRGKNLRTAPLGDGATARLREKNGSWTISIQQKQQDVKTVKVRYGE